ncbi:hypothetical protein KSP40_PGU017453 [Platanthera guangdongensis]|uniref:Uncharacterized protein n=1 Tax=Platanthera guangdongensis TaxID=2320717 RepID=A0ABR2MZN8_9ASPA
MSAPLPPSLEAKVPDVVTCLFMLGVAYVLDSFPEKSHSTAASSLLFSLLFVSPPSSR